MTKKNYHTTRFWAYLLLVMACWSCIDPLEQDPLVVSEDGYVIEAFVSDIPREHEVRIGKTVSNFTTAELYVTNAEVSIISEMGTEVLTEKEFGRYFTSATFAAQHGVSYKLRIAFEDGGEQVIIESDLEELPDQSPEIQSVDFRLEESQEIRGNRLADVENLNWRINSQMDGVRNLYYVMEKTTEIRTPFDEDGKSCYRTQKATSDLILLSTDMISDFLVFGVDITDVSINEDFLYNYSLNILQYTLNDQAFTYIQELKELSNNSGSIFGFTPTRLDSNMSNVGTGDRSISGYFLMASGSSIRYTMPALTREFYLNRHLMEAPQSDGPPRPWPECNGQQPEPLSRLTRHCFDCSLLEGSALEKPIFFD